MSEQPTKNDNVKNGSEALNTETGDNQNTIDDDAYESKARQEINEWMNPDDTVISKTLSAISAPIDKAGDALVNAPQYGDTLRKAIEEALTSISDAASWSIDTQDILDAYNQQTNVTMTTLEDIQKLPLHTVDDQVKLFKSKYVAATSAQGVTTGMVGWAGIPADVAGLITANLRAITEYAANYGFDIDKESEQLFAISLLSIATSTSAAQRQAALDESLGLLKDPETLAFNKVNEEIISRVIRQTATKVATDLVKTKAAQIVPAVGALVAGGVNANYTATICDAAYQCYRHRFLDLTA